MALGLAMICSQHLLTLAIRQINEAFSNLVS